MTIALWIDESRMKDIWQYHQDDDKMIIAIVDILERYFDVHAVFYD